MKLFDRIKTIDDFRAAADKAMAPRLKEIADEIDCRAIAALVNTEPPAVNTRAEAARLVLDSLTDPATMAQVKKDRHKPGYMAEYMRKRRTKK